MRSTKKKVKQDDQDLQRQCRQNKTKKSPQLKITDMFGNLPQSWNGPEYTVEEGNFEHFFQKNKI